MFIHDISRTSMTLIGRPPPPRFPSSPLHGYTFGNKVGSAFQPRFCNILRTTTKSRWPLWLAQLGCFAVITSHKNKPLPKGQHTSGLPTTGSNCNTKSRSELKISRDSTIPDLSRLLFSRCAAQPATSLHGAAIAAALKKSGIRADCGL